MEHLGFVFGNSVSGELNGPHRELASPMDAEVLNTPHKPDTGRPFLKP